MLTKKQAQTLKYIKGFLKKHNYSPSFKEIANHFGISAVSTVATRVKALKEKGLISHQWNRSRSLTVITEKNSESVSENQVEIPLLGNIPASPPQEAIVSSENDCIQIDKKLIGKGKYFAVTVKGDSMIEEGIINGDLAIIRQQESISNGQVGAFLVDQEVTLKKFFKEKGKIVLMPANRNMPPILIHNKTVEIQGILVALIRKYNQ